MKKLKVFLIIALVLALIIGVLAVVFVLIPKLNEGEVVDSINGKTPKEAFEEAIRLKEMASRYEYTVGVEMAFKVGFVPVYKVEIDPMALYGCDGENQYGKLYPEAREEMRENDLWDAEMEATSYDEYWYIDGCTYISENGIKNKYDMRIVDEYSEYERTIARLLADSDSEVTCYSKDGLYYFTVSTVDSYGDTELYTIYLSAEGRLERIEIKYSYQESFIVVEALTRMVYNYDGLEPIQAPADADSYKTIK